jgi:hypothetical protein
LQDLQHCGVRNQGMLSETLGRGCERIELHGRFGRVPVDALEVHIKSKRIASGLSRQFDQFAVANGKDLAGIVAQLRRSRQEPFDGQVPFRVGELTRSWGSAAGSPNFYSIFGSIWRRRTSRSRNGPPPLRRNRPAHQI